MIFLVLDCCNNRSGFKAKETDLYIYLTTFILHSQYQTMNMSGIIAIVKCILTTSSGSTTPPNFDVSLCSFSGVVFCASDNLEFLCLIGSPVFTWLNEKASSNVLIRWSQRISPYRDANVIAKRRGCFGRPCPCLRFFKMWFNCIKDRKNKLAMKLLMDVAIWILTWCICWRYLKESTTRYACDDGQFIEYWINQTTLAILL